jgi:catechol 2,3-dioxygenase-like lactoylglutathione lyase family enzyme
MRPGVRRAGIALLAMALLSAAQAAGLADSASEGAGLISDLRRVTLIVADPLPALAFYHDLLGLEIIYDQRVDDPAQLQLLGPDITRARAIALAASRPGIDGASLGLVQLWTDVGMYRPPGDRDLALLFRSSDLSGLYARLQAAKVSFVSGTSSYSQSRGPTEAFTVRDPLGNRVSFAQLSSDKPSALARLLAWMTGDFDNRAQFAAQPPSAKPVFALLGQQRRAVSVPALGQHVVYAQINSDADPAQVYRQRLLVFTPGDGDTLRMTTWSFADEPAHRDILTRLDDLASMPREAFVPSLPPGCEAEWAWRDEVLYSQIRADACHIDSQRGGRIAIQSTEIVGSGGIRSEESGYSLDGRMLFGLPEGQYYDYRRR